VAKETQQQNPETKGVVLCLRQAGAQGIPVSLCKGQSQPNWKPVAEANLAKDTEVICVVIEEANLVVNSTEWIYDTGASTHFCPNKELMQNFEDVPDCECAYIKKKKLYDC